MIQAELSSPLVPGQTYYLSLAVSTGGFGAIYSYTMALASNGIGLKSSTQPVTWSMSLLDNQPVLYSAQVVNDTLDWVILTGTYVPDSAYQYIQVGNFLTDALTLTEVIDSTAASQLAYVVIDGVCVSELPGGCDFSDGLSNASAAVESFYFDGEHSQLVLVSALGSPKPWQIAIYDMAGKRIELIWVHVGSERHSIDLHGYLPGIYTLQAITPQQTPINLKFHIPGP
jgi:hypothetical protein